MSPVNIYVQERKVIISFHLHREQRVLVEEGNRQSWLKPVSCCIIAWLIPWPEMSFDFQQTAWYFISEDRTLHNHHYENLSLAIA
jgi:hypothetical protein